MLNCVVRLVLMVVSDGLLVKWLVLWFWVVVYFGVLVKLWLVVSIIM